MLLVPAGVAVTEGTACTPDGGVALEAAAKAQLPDPVTAPHAGGVLNVGQNVPATTFPAIKAVSRAAAKQAAHSAFGKEGHA